jgi:sugar-specific transcriptional regulator TrmB
MFTEQQTKILGLSKRENNVLRSLENAKSIFVLSKYTKIPRATLYPIIKKLYERGFVKCKSDGSRYIYQRISKKAVSTLFQKIALDFKTVPEEQKQDPTPKGSRKYKWITSLLSY